MCKVAPSRQRSIAPNAHIPIHFRFQRMTGLPTPVANNPIGRRRIKSGDHRESESPPRSAYAQDAQTQSPQTHGYVYVRELSGSFPM
jgi:hypothetical protein